MGPPNLSETFRTGFVQSKSTFFLLSIYQALDDLGAENTNLLRLDVSTKKAAVVHVPWSATRLWVHPEKLEVIVTGPAGRYSTKTSTAVTDEEILPGSRGPEGLGDIRDLRRIGSRLFAAGMNRQVYIQENEGSWGRFDAGCVVKPSTKKVVGFNSIDGTAEDDIYAIGFAGEIWRWDGKNWVQIDSPTNLVLNRVRAVAPDEIYVCGKKGVLLRGHADEWDAIEHDVDDELWDVEVFNGDIYLAAEDRLYRLTKKDTLEPVDMKLKPRPTCGSLHAADGVLLSVGRKHVCWTDDGKKWHDITP